jgi:hypothetical protein
MKTYCPEGPIFVGGDQLTSARFESAQNQRENCDYADKWARFRFYSLDFHFLMNLADVSNLLLQFIYSQNQ